MMIEMKEAYKVLFLDTPVSSGSLFGPAVEGFAERFTEAQKSSQAMRHFLPKRTSSSSASSRPRPAATQQTAKPTPTTPHSSASGTFQRLRNPPEQPGRKRRGQSLATAGPPRKQPLMCLSPPCLALGAEESVFMYPHGPTIVPRCLSAVIADKIKHKFSKREQKSFSAYHKRPALMQPVCTAVSTPCPGRPSPVCQLG